MYGRRTSSAYSSWFSEVFESARNALKDILSMNVFGRSTIGDYFPIDAPCVMKSEINVSCLPILTSEQENQFDTGASYLLISTFW